MSRPLSWLKTSQERNEQVIKDIEAGSEPRFTHEKHVSYQEFTKVTRDRRLQNLPRIMKKGLPPPAPAQ